MRALASGEVDGQLHLLVKTTERIEGPILRCRCNLAPAPGAPAARRFARAPRRGGDLAQADRLVRRTVPGRT